MTSTLLRIGALLGASGVALSAYGAHGLRRTLENAHKRDADVAAKQQQQQQQQSSWFWRSKPQQADPSQSNSSSVEPRRKPEADHPVVPLTAADIDHRVAAWQSATWQQLLHAAVIVALANGSLVTARRGLIPGYLIAAGTTAFSGTIYARSMAPKPDCAQCAANKRTSCSKSATVASSTVKDGTVQPPCPKGQPPLFAYLAPTGGLLMISGWLALLFS